MNLNEMQEAVHKTALEHGWWEPQEITDGNGYTMEQAGMLHMFAQRTFGDCIALCHSELSEALEAFRDPNYERHETFGPDGKPEGPFTELADCIIRILDMAGHYDVDMEDLVQRKIAYNENRPYRHGNKNL